MSSSLTVHALKLSHAEFGQVVVELRSPTDSLEELQAKMREYIVNGARLGWLINPQQRQVELYRQDQQVEVLQAPLTLSGEDVLPGFVLSMQRIFA